MLSLGDCVLRLFILARDRAKGGVRASTLNHELQQGNVMRGVVLVDCEKSS